MTGMRIMGHLAYFDVDTISWLSSLSDLAVTNGTRLGELNNM